MKRIIKVTENQLRETEGAAFEYLDISNDNPYGNNSEISADGKIDNIEFGEPVTGDEVSNTMTNQVYNRFYNTYGRTPRYVSENDNNNDGVDDFYNHDELDTLSDGDESNNLMKVPQSVENKLEILISQIQKLNSKQQAMILNKLIETLELQNIPYSWTKELMLKLSSKNR